MIYNFTEYNAASGFVYKNTSAAYVFNGTTFSQITDADYPATTVPGIVYLDGYIFVMKPNAEILNSALEDPFTWNALDFITAEVDPSPGKAIAKYQNYIVAFCERTTEFFYDAGNASGSPLSRMAQNVSNVGCVNGYTVANSAGTVFWVGRNKNRGYGVYALNGLTPEAVSTPAIDRVLNTLGFATVYSYGFRVNGSHFYMLNCVSDNLTLVYDVGNKLWSQWTYSTAGTAQTLTSLTQSNGLATATKSSHGYSSGDLVRIAGATPAGYNGDFLVTYVDANTFTYPVDATIAASATGTITATKYTQGYFPFISYCYSDSKDLLQHETDGYVYELSASVFQDMVVSGTGSPIQSVARTDRIDGGNTDQKIFGYAQIIGDQVSTLVFERHSNDDAQNWSAPKSASMSLRMPQVRRLGKGRRMVFELHHVDNTRCRLEALEIGE